MIKNIKVAVTTIAVLFLLQALCATTALGAETQTESIQPLTPSSSFKVIEKSILFSEENHKKISSELLLSIKNQPFMANRIPPLLPKF